MHGQNNHSKKLWPEQSAFVTRTAVQSQRMYGIGLILSPTYPYRVEDGSEMVDPSGISLAASVNIGDELLSIDDVSVLEVISSSVWHTSI